METTTGQLLLTEEPPPREESIPPPVDPPLRRVRAGDLELSYTVEGPEEAPAIVLVHGVPGTVADFRYLGPVVARRARVYRLDMPGFGGSVGAALSDQRGATRAAAVARFATAVGLERFAVLGHSMGGHTALMTAADFPDRVSALVLVASVGLRRHHGMVVPQPVMRVGLQLARLPGLRGQFVRRTREAYDRMGFPGADALTADDLYLHARVVLGVSFGVARRAVRRVVCPALVAFADDDHLVEPEIGEELVVALRGAVGLPYETGGHNIQKTRAGSLGERIGRLLVP